MAKFGGSKINNGSHAYIIIATKTFNQKYKQTLILWFFFTKLQIKCFTEVMAQMSAL